MTVFFSGLNKLLLTGKKLHPTVYSHNWGFVIPCKSGVVWQQQTGGIMCNQVDIEGIFIPLDEPLGGLLKALQSHNYNYKNTSDIWKQIREAMHFDYDKIDAPSGMPPNQEGLQWIVLTRFEDGWGHGSWVKDLVGMTLALIYPNCD